MTLTPRSPRRQRSRATSAATARVHPLVVALALAGALPSLAMAQAAPLLPAVTVTASGAAEPLPEAYAGGQVARGGRLGILGNQDMMDVPFSMTSYTAQLIQDQQARSVAEVLNNDPGVRTSYGFGNFAETFVVRGFQLNGDDVSYNGLFGITPRQLIAVEGVERVEIFKGANAFLNGVTPTGSATGGLINLAPKYAPAAGITQATLDYTSTAQVGGHVDVGRRFGPDNRLGIRVNALARGGDANVDKESRQERLLALGLDYQGTKFRINGDVNYQKQAVTQGRTAALLVNGLTGLPAVPSARANFEQPWAKSQQEDTYGTIRAEYDLLPALTAYVGLGAHHANEWGNSGGIRVNDTGSGSSFRLLVPYKQDNTAEEIGLRGKFTTGPVKHQVNVAWSGVQTKTRQAYGWSDSYDTNLYNPPVVAEPPLKQPTTGDLFNPKVNSRVDLTSYALSDTMSFFRDRVLFTAGVRYQSIRERVYNPASGEQTPGFSDTATSPAFGLVVKPMDSVSVYYNYMEGLAKGPTAQGQVSNPGQVFPPIRSRQNEFGVKWDGGKFGSQMALYEIRQPTSGILNGTFMMIGDQRNRGAEISAFGEPLNGLRVLAGAAYIDAVLQGTGDPAKDGNKPFGVPIYTLNAGVEWDLPWVRGLTVSGRYLQTGSQYVTLPNTVSLPAWARFDIGARYTIKAAKQRYTLRAGIENVTNKAYWESALGGYLKQGSPRTYKVALTADF